MRRQIAVFGLSAAALVLAQAPEKQTVPHASVSGVVKDAGTGQPLADYLVSTFANATWVGDSIRMSAATREVSVTTDSQGHYRLGDLTPGQYRLQVRHAQNFIPQHTKNISLSGQDLAHIDFNVVTNGSITGKIVDENKEPLPGMSVFLVAQEHFLGNQGYFLRSMVRSNDRGEYTLSQVPAGRPYLILVEKRESKLPARSVVPLSPNLRRRVPRRTWYPNALVKEGASPIVLRPGERRESVDMEVRKGPSYCVEGLFEPPAGPEAMEFMIEAQQPSSGISNNGGMFVMAPGGTTEPDGKFRICDLHPGGYRLTAMPKASAVGQQPAAYGVLEINVTDRDQRNVKVPLMPGLPLQGEVVWDGEAPETPVDAKVHVALNPLLRTHFRGEENSGRTSIPGVLSFPRLLLDSYQVWAVVNGPGLYIKEVNYGGRNVQHEPLRLGSALPGVGLRVVIARDGATLRAHVQDKSGSPVPDMQVVIVPEEINSESDLAARLVSGQTDQAGNYTSTTLRPGKHYVAASGDVVERTPESIRKLWRSYRRFKEVEVTPSGNVEVNLEPVKIE